MAIAILAFVITKRKPQTASYFAVLIAVAGGLTTLAWNMTNVVLMGFEGDNKVFAIWAALVYH